VKFFKTVIDKVEITDDSNFLLRLYQYFSRNDVLLTELDEMLQHERIKQSSTQAQTIAHNNIVQSQQQVQPQIQPQVQATKPPKLTSPFVTQPKEKKENPIQTPTVQKQPTEQADSSDELMAALFGDNNSKKKKEKNKKEKQKKEKASFSFGLFGKKQDTENTHPSSLEQQQPKQQQTVAEPYAMGGSGVEATEYYGGYTGEETVISEDGGGSLAYLELVESSTPGAIQRISLDFTNSYITIGRESKDVVQANIRFNASFKQISRMHARIDRNGDTYSLIDLGSANRTMVNNQILIPNNPCVLKNGDKITFATNIPVIYSVVI
jgi:DNA polymerase III gamma/tau subunit